MNRKLKQYCGCDLANANNWQSQHWSAYYFSSHLHPRNGPRPLRLCKEPPPRSSLDVLVPLKPEDTGLNDSADSFHLNANGAAKFKPTPKRCEAISAQALRPDNETPKREGNSSKELFDTKNDLMEEVL